MTMFDFLKKKRIAKYIQSVGSYVASTFKPEPEKKSDGIRYRIRSSGIKYKLPVVQPEEKEPDVQYQQRQYSISPAPKKQDGEEQYSSQETDLDRSEAGGIRYSERYSLDDDIPNDGDSFAAASVRAFLSQNVSSPSLSRLVNKLDNYLDLTFVDILIRYINEKGWRDSRVYKAAQMDRRLFSKIMSDRNYKPSKDTALALVIALELSLKQASDLLSRAGYTLSHSNKRDVIIEYFIREGIYDLSDINEVLYRLDQKIIGR